MTPHIDEGALHAYLDGALDEFPAPEAERVRQHLDECGDCRERLEAERVVRDHAASILSVASPQRDVPSFEELRSWQRVRTASRESAPHRLARVGWAASLILAVGVGWALRGGPSRSTALPVALEGEQRGAVAQQGPEVAAVATADVDAPAAEATARAVPRARDRTDVAAGTAAEAEPTGLLPARTELGAVSVEVPTFEDGVSLEVVRDLESAEPPLPQAPTIEPLVAESVVIAASVGAAPAGATPDPERFAEPERNRSPSDVVTSAARTAEVPGVGPFVRNQDGDQDARDDLRDDEAPYSLVVPDLEVLDVRFRGGVRPEGQVVLQRLESGDTLQVIHLPPDIDPSSLDDAAPADRELVLETGSGWVVMRAPVGRDALMEFMTRLLGEN